MTHPQFRIDTLQEHSRKLTNHTNRTSLLATDPVREEIAGEAVSLRLCLVSDAPSLEGFSALGAEGCRTASISSPRWVARTSRRGR
jgi:hypothetical protein